MGARKVPQARASPYAVGDHARGRADIHPNVRFVLGRINEVGELTVGQARGHEMRVPCSQAGRDGPLGNGEQYKRDARSASVDHAAEPSIESRPAVTPLYIRLPPPSHTPPHS